MLSLSPLHEGIGFFAVGCWLGYIGYQIEYHRLPFWLYAALIVKVAAAWGFGWLYASYYCHGDTLKAYLTAERIAAYLWEAPLDGLALLFRELVPAWEKRGWELFFSDPHLYGYDYEWSEPANYFFYRLMVPVYILGGGSYYGFQGIMGLIGGLLSYTAYQRWQRSASLPAGFWKVWFFLPSILLWTSGALRDTLVLPLMLYGAAWLASVQRISDFWGILALLLVSLLRLEALALALVAGFLYRWGRFWMLAPVTLAGILLLGFYIGSWAYSYQQESLDPRFHPEVPEASVFRIHYKPDFWGSLWGWIQALPHGLLGPFPHQAQKPQVLLYAMEVWLLAVIGFYYSIQGRWEGRTILLVGLGLFVIGVTAMAMPYWGTLARQRLYGLLWIGLGIGMAWEKARQQREHRLSQT